MMKKISVVVALWIVVTSIWWSVGVLCFIIPSYEYWAMQSGQEPTATLQVAIDASQIVRGSWHWIAVFALIVTGTLSSLGYTVRTARRLGQPLRGEPQLGT
jgi:uncharacterized membrane protein